MYIAEYALLYQHTVYTRTDFASAERTSTTSVNDCVLTGPPQSLELSYRHYFLIPQNFEQTLTVRGLCVCSQYHQQSAHQLTITRSWYAVC